jgi:hypothetical protein
MLKHPLPKWNNEQGVARLADEILAKDERIRQAFLDFVNDSAWADNADEFDKLIDKFNKAEAAAVEAAERGNVALLAKLLLDENWQWLRLETREFMSEVMLGKHRSVGHPKMTPEERRAATATHRAAAEFNLLKSQLAKLYPEIARAAVRERASNIATKRTGVSPRTLENYVRRSKKAPHRINH